MTIPSDKPKTSKIKIRIAEGLTITCFLVLVTLDLPEWIHYSLLALAIGTSLYAGILTLKSAKADKDWMEKQPDYVDPYKGSPDYPHRKEGGAILVGIFSFMAFAYFAVPMRDRALSSNDWWVLVPLILSIVGFSYARRIHNKYGVVFTAWRETQRGG